MEIWGTLERGNSANLKQTSTSLKEDRYDCNGLITLDVLQPLTYQLHDCLYRLRFPMRDELIDSIYHLHNLLKCFVWIVSYVLQLAGTAANG